MFVYINGLDDAHIETCWGHLAQAIKRIQRVFADKLDSVRIIREVRLMRSLCHPNIVRGITVLLPSEPRSFDEIFIVVELCTTDLYHLIRKKTKFTLELVRSLSWQLLNGLEYIHAARVFHRDLKPANLLICQPANGSDWELKICDFGIARASFGVPEEENPEAPVLWTDYVATRWYRAPELICMYSGAYDAAIDM